MPTVHTRNIPVMIVERELGMVISANHRMSPPKANEATTIVTRYRSTSLVLIHAPGVLGVGFRWVFMGSFLDGIG